MRRRRPLRRRLFAWFGVTIVAAIALSSAVHFLLSPGSPRWREVVARSEAFVDGRFARVWDDAAARDELAGAIARDLGVGVRLEDARGRALHEVGEPCGRRRYSTTVHRGGVVVGRVHACPPPERGRHLALPFASLGVAGLVLWAASWLVARRIARPLTALSDVTRRIGEGELGARARVDPRQPAEVGELAATVNVMAERIARQLDDQRELLAAVSHELRSPLARMRVLTELAREPSRAAHNLEAIELEIAEIDALVSKLLASSRLDFAALDRREVAPLDLAREALERAGLDATLLRDAGAPSRARLDPTLVHRALANLLDNARDHGGGARGLEVGTRAGAVVFVVEDAGPGFPEGARERAFESFRRGDGPAAERRDGLGLGLALVQRIARAHGGRAWIEEASPVGARVGLELPAST
ncbi:MAG: HAMP domain-containing histidine kinase [Polyangiaceae bacterium]|nr:HAMP domain-containing histidine kinase [Polyangiaceae bacterium]